MFSEISARAQENFSGARVIRAYVQEEAEIAAFETSNQEYIARSLKLVRLMGMLWPTLETMLGFAIVLVLWLGGREVISGRITVGDFVAFNTYMVQLTWPIIALGWVINIFQRGTASMGRINEILVEKPEIEDSDAVKTACVRTAQRRGATLTDRGRDRVSQSEFLLQRPAGSARRQSAHSCRAAAWQLSALRAQVRPRWSV